MTDTSSSALQLVDDNIVYVNGDGSTITVVDGQHKRCLAFGGIMGGLYVVLREGTDGPNADAGEDDRSVSKRLRRGDKRGGKTTAGTPVTSETKRTLSVFTFDAATADIHFRTHVSVAGWTSLVVSSASPFVILSDYNTAHSEVLEWLPSSKTLRRVWEGKGCCPNHFNDGNHILLLLYSARKLVLYDAKTMKEIEEVNARSREVDIVDVFAANNRAVVAYENGTVSIFAVTEDTIKRIGDVGKVLDGKVPTDMAFMADSEALLLYCDDVEEACVLNPIVNGNKESYEKGSADKSLFEDWISEAAAQKALRGGSAVKASSVGTSKDKRSKKEKEKEKREANKATDSEKKAVAKESSGTSNTTDASSTAANANARTSNGNGRRDEGGISLVALVGIAAVSMAITAVFVAKIASSK